MRKIKQLPMLCVISLCLNMPSLVAAATSIEAPENLSQEAQDYLNKARVGAMDGGDSSDPETLARIRTMLGKIFLRSAMKIDPELFFTEQPMGSVTGYWINSKAPAKPGPVIIYLHGGGHILGSAKTNLGSAIRIARSGIIPVLSIDYRLAPEHPFPADLDDSVAAYRWLLDNGYAARQIGVYGDSAGGGEEIVDGDNRQGVVVLSDAQCGDQREKCAVTAGFPVVPPSANQAENWVGSKLCQVPDGGLDRRARR